MRFIKKNNYFIHEGEPTGFFAGVIRGKVSVRKTHIFNKKTKEIEIKPLYKMVVLKKPSMIRKSHQKISSDLTFLQSKKKSNSESIHNIPEKEKELNEIKNENKFNQVKFYENNINPQRRDNISTSSKFIRDRHFKIVKEFFDEDKYDYIEEELFRRGEGYCFGEWALIYKQPRSASIYTLEDCVFFTLDETPFKNSFLKSLNSSEFNKKKFALKNFLPFDMVDERQLSIYKNIVPITCTRNQIIFNEGDFSDSIYLIYLGSFTLEKKYQYKKFSVLNLEKGSIVGLESLFEGIKSKYKCSLKLSNGFDFGIIFQLKINKLRPYVINKMKISFETNYNLFLNSWKELFKKNIFVRESISNKLNTFFNENLEDGKNENFDNLEKGIDIYQLGIKKENKYEALFKKSIKLKDYENRKKDGSLRIFSSKQRSRIYDKDDEKNNQMDNVNIIKYYKEFTKKPEYDRRTLKTAHQLRIRKLNSLNYSDNHYSNYNTKRNYNNINKSEASTEINRQHDEINQKYFKTDNQINNNNSKKIIKNMQEKKMGLKLKNFKFNVSIIDDNKIKGNIRYNPSEIKEFADNNKQGENSSLNLKDKNKINNFINITKEHTKKSNEDINTKITKLNEKIINKLKEKKERTKLIQNYNLKDGSISYKIKEENAKNKNNLKNKFNVSSNPNITLKKKFSSTQNLFSTRNNHNIKLLLKDDKNNTKKFLKKSSSQRDIISFIRKSNKTSINKDKGKIKINKNQNINCKLNSQPSDKISYQELNTFSGKYYNIFKEFNLNNGFSVSYFKKINSINEFNNYEIIQKKPQFPSCSNKFKVTFDSGDFNIPLVSSSIKLKGNTMK